MPIYEFVCQDCSCKFEEIVYNSNSHEVLCPACTSNSLKKLISNTAPPRFNGPGFYATEYKKVKVNPEDIG